MVKTPFERVWKAFEEVEENERERREIREEEAERQKERLMRVELARAENEKKAEFEISKVKYKRNAKDQKDDVRPAQNETTFCPKRNRRGANPKTRKSRENVGGSGSLNTLPPANGVPTSLRSKLWGPVARLVSNFYSKLFIHIHSHQIYWKLIIDVECWLLGSSNIP